MTPPTILCCPGNVFTELLTNNDVGIHRHTSPTILLLLRIFVAVETCLPSRWLVNKVGIHFSEPLPSNNRRDTHTDTRPLSLAGSKQWNASRIASNSGAVVVSVMIVIVVEMFQAMLSSLYVLFACIFVYMFVCTEPQNLGVMSTKFYVSNETQLSEVN
jgi:hypothetical protein